MSLPRCETTELERVWCSCSTCDRGFSMTTEERELMAHRFNPVTTVASLEQTAGRPLPQYRVRDRQWRVPTPEPTDCEHQEHDLCPTCDQLLDGLLYDLPELLHQLEVAMRKATSFKPHGHRKGDIEKPDEAPIPWNPAAAACRSDLQALTRTRWTNRRTLLTELSRLASRAHQVIDRPKDRDTTMCPHCRTSIDITDRTLITCPDCRYHATWEQHQIDLLDANGGMMLTADEIRFVLSRTGEPISRQRIWYLFKRHGLNREKITVPTWRDRKLVTEAQYVYRLRDVRSLQAELAQGRTA